MHILYNDDDRGPFNPATVGRIDPTSAYLRHYSNMLYLSFIAAKSQDWAEKRQAEKEIKICQRKLDYWYRLADIRRLTIGTDKLKKDWSSK
jgi:hypothetical protein